jgi:hypothetical protein
MNSQRARRNRWAGWCLKKKTAIMRVLAVVLGLAGLVDWAGQVLMNTDFDEHMGAEEERRAHLRYLESIHRILSAIAKNTVSVDESWSATLTGGGGPLPSSPQLF